MMDFSSSRKRPPLILELTPLIDVVFLLLIFFMVSTTFVQEPAALEVDLPSSSAAALVPEDADTEILLGPGGEVLLGDRQMTLDELEAEFQRIAEENPATQLVLRGDKAVPYQKLIEVMSLAHAQGLTRFSLATNQPAEGGGQSTTPKSGQGEDSN